MHHRTSTFTGNNPTLCMPDLPNIALGQELQMKRRYSDPLRTIKPANSMDQHWLNLSPRWNYNRSVWQGEDSYTFAL